MKTIRGVLEKYHNPGNIKSYLDRALKEMVEIVESLNITEQCLSKDEHVQVAYGKGYRRAMDDVKRILA